MKVAPKLALVAWLAFLPVLGLHALFSVRREQALFRSDMERGLSLLGEHLRQVAVAEWDLNGESEVEALLAAAARTDRDIRIRWRSNGPAEVTRGLIVAAPGRMTWLEPVAIDGKPIGRIEISESLAPMYHYVRVTLLRIGVLSLALGLASVALAHAMGERLIGGRLRALVAFARRTGQGQLGHRIELGGRDEISALAASLNDMSEQLADAFQQTQAANNDRLSMLQQLRHADRLSSIGRLASGVAHELGTPLNVAMGHAKRIEKGSLTPAELGHAAEVIHRQMDRMAATIRNILGFVRSTTPPQECVDLVRVVESVRELLSPLLEERGVELAVVSALRDAPVRGSEIQLEQALSNLISNAVDATGDGGRVEIEIGRMERSSAVGAASRSMLAVQVRDQGPGVPEERVPRLFEPFFTSKPEGSGTGLGLWITQGIVHDHEGRIEFANLTGGGACFTVLLPSPGSS